MVDFVREQRLRAPAVMSGDVTVTAPPGLGKPVPGNPVARLLPVAMLVAGVGMMAVYFTSGAASPRNPMFMFFPVMMGMSVLGSVVYGARGGASWSAEVDENRRKYLRHLDFLDAGLAGAVDGQRRSQHWSHTEPGSLWAVVGGRRMWERRPGDPDFCRVRIGVGEHALCTPLVTPELGTAEEHDPVTVSAMRRLIRQRSVVDDLPISLPLREFTVITIEGDTDRGRAMVRAMLCQLAVWHGPDQVGIAVVVGPSERATWDWLKWLPHHRHSRETDAVGPTRLVYDSLGPAVVASIVGQRHAVAILDGGTASDFEAGGVPSGLTVVEIGATVSMAANRLRVHVDADEFVVRGDGSEVTGLPDSLTPGDAAVCARRMAPYVLGAATARAQHDTSTARGWLDLMGITDPHCVDVEMRWAKRRRITPVPIGVSEDGSAVMLDINEAAQGGIGPHGLCVGATGSGKSDYYL
jgi:DNA segregation ATPase FtsK/SpoIIIE, S-DNA-T family